MEKAIKSQIEFLEQLRKAERNFKKSNLDVRAKPSYLMTRIEFLDKLEAAFTKNHLEIISGLSEEQKSQKPYFINDVQDEFQECAINYKCILNEHLNVNPSVTTKTTNPILKENTEVQLPRIQLPLFSGKYNEWQSFYDMFVSLIHGNTALSSVQKLHYLKSSLSGEPAALLRNFSTTSANYINAWEQLTKRYNNRRYNCNAILKALFGQKLLQYESSKSIRELLDTTTSCLKALNNLNIATTEWDAIVIYLVVSKLDVESHRQWENYVSGLENDLPKWEQLEKFLETRFRSLEMLDTSKQLPSAKSNVHHKNLSNQLAKPRVFHSAINVKPSVSAQVCAMCDGPHYIYYCVQFKKEPVIERQIIAKTKRLCFNCLAPTHSVSNCHQNTSCRKCGKKHHIMLHFENEDKQQYNTRHGEKPNEEIQNSKRETALAMKETNVIANFSRGDIKTHNVLLATAVVKSSCRNGSSFVIRALLDQGSQASFISEDTVQLLGLKRINVNGKVSSLGDGHMTVKHAVSFEVESRLEPEKIIRVNAYVLKSLTSLLPVREVHIPEWLELKNLPLADPGFAAPGKVDLLLGADIYGEILLEGMKRSNYGNLIAQNTLFGWILSGKVSRETSSQNIKTLHVQIKEDELLKTFWEMENEPNSIVKKLTREELLCENFYEKTTLRREDGRFTVRLPFRTTNPQCQYGKSCDIATRKLLSSERRLCKNPLLLKEYNKVLEEYTTLNHMKLVESNDINNPKAVYLPHHAVVREDKDTTKVRVVFNASSKGVNNVSLNDDLLVGPKLQQDLRHLLLRWRRHPICIVADLVKMYRQVYVNEDDANFQRILWRTTPNEMIQHYKLLTLTFGTACAPYLAVKTLQILADLEKDNYPLAAQITKRDYYIDDLMTGCETEQEALQIYQTMNGLMSAGGFQLQKWSSNNQYFLNHIEKDKLNTQTSVPIKVDNMMKVLGICWNRSTDQFEYRVNLPETEQPVTKRKVLSDIARLYDPIGWIAPVVITAKIFIQKLWKANLEWDVDLPRDLLTEWLNFRDELRHVPNIMIPRWFNSTKRSKLELHAFSDASSAAYAAVVYLRVVDESNQVNVKLVTAKTKVAPIEKEVSIPRLELCGAVLAAKLINELTQVLDISKKDVYAWTDSTIVLAWLRGPVNRWVTYVSNRVSHIHTITDVTQWRHVSTQLNPADCASRGIQPSELKSKTLWWNGPSWLSETEIKIDTVDVAETNEEERIRSFITVHKDFNFIWMKFSDLTKMLKVISLCRRFLKTKLPLPERQPYPKYVTTEEMKKTLQILIKQVQEIEFKEEIDSLKLKGYVPKRSGLYTLYPFVDKNGILRVGGRINQAEVNYDQKHPIIMPAKNHLSKLIIANAHIKTLHGGPQLMMSFLRSQFWILRARDMIKSYYRSCVTCLRYSKAATTQLMGQLPEVRLKPSRPFKTAGVDYAGPINIRFSPGRGAKSYKGYVCLFVCMVTRAIHLEAVTDLTAKGFIAAFKRFVARRGACNNIYSDNGTNFVGADVMLRNMFDRAKSKLPDEIAELLTLESTTWHFIPPSAPNFGGLWEAGVRCAKAHLKRVIGDSTLTYEEISTLLAQIEACLNSRPLSFLSDTPDDPLPLTPGHFLVGEPLVTINDVNYADENVIGLDRWKLIQKMLNTFWKRWSKEFLSNLNQRNKWCTKKPDMDVGDIVVVKDDNIPPAKWILGKIVDKHAGPDNVTRVVTIKYKGGLFKRPVNKLCVLTKSNHADSDLK